MGLMDLYIIKFSNGKYAYLQQPLEIGIKAFETDKIEFATQMSGLDADNLIFGKEHIDNYEDFLSLKPVKVQIEIKEMIKGDDLI